MLQSRQLDTNAVAVGHFLNGEWPRVKASLFASADVSVVLDGDDSFFVLDDEVRLDGTKKIRSHSVADNPRMKRSMGFLASLVQFEVTAKLGCDQSQRARVGHVDANDQSEAIALAALAGFKANPSFTVEQASDVSDVHETSSSGTMCGTQRTTHVGQ